MKSWIIAGIGAMATVAVAEPVFAGPESYFAVSLNWPPFRPDSRHNAGGLGISSSTGLCLTTIRRIELITGAARRRHWTTEQKLRIIEESFAPGETVSSVARRRGVAPNLLYRWRRLMTEGGAAAVGSDEPVVGSSEVAPARGAHARPRTAARPQDAWRWRSSRRRWPSRSQKNRACGSCRSRGTVPDEGRRRDARGGPLPSP